MSIVLLLINTQPHHSNKKSLEEKNELLAQLDDYAKEHFK